jgi:pimeloyl-ACP methyl ester carboxylesterase
VVEGAESPFASQFARDGVRLIALERAGYGVSTAQPGRRFVDVAPDIGELVDCLGVDRFAVVGWSTGAPHALAAAVGLGDRVVAVGAIASIAPLDKVGVDGLGEAVFLEMAVNDPDGLRVTMRELAAAMRSDPEGTSGALLGPLMSDRDVAYCTRPENAALISADLVESARGEWAGYTDDCIADAVFWGFDLAAVAVPVSLIHGTEDRIVPVQHSRWLATTLPNASLLEADGEGHISVLDHLPRLCAELVQAV